MIWLAASAQRRQQLAKLLPSPVFGDMSIDSPEDCVVIVSACDRRVGPQHMAPLLYQRLHHHGICGCGDAYQRSPITDQAQAV